ncbi:MAG: S8 family serine peptidase [Candidatus Sericytochromatia bacterium]
MTDRKSTKLVSAALALGILAACSPVGGPLLNPQSNPALQAQSAARGSKIFNADPRPQAAPNQVIVKVKPGDPNLFVQTLARSGARVVDFFDIDTRVFLVESASRNTEDLIRQFSQDRNVEIAQPNYLVSLNQIPAAPRQQGRPNMAAPNDPLYAQQWHLPHVGALDAWGQGGQGNKDLIVAVVDTGVDYNHPDLKANTIKGKDFTKESPDGLDPIDSFGHGTHVAGIIAAVANNGEGVAGAAPNVKILAVKVLSAKGGGSLFAIAGGIKHSVDMGAKIVNLSLGGPAVTDLISSAVGYWATKKGALLIAAAGNSNTAVGTPARIDDYYMAVAASDQANKRAKFSCYGKELSVSAPGVQIMATTPTYKVPLNDHGYPQNYAFLQGTSMATPLVAGVAALVWSRHPEWTAKQVRQHLEKTAVDVGAPGKDNESGFGVVNAAAAMR